MRFSGEISGDGDGAPAVSTAKEISDEDLEEPGEIEERNMIR